MNTPNIEAVVARLDSYTSEVTLKIAGSVNINLGLMTDNERVLLAQKLNNAALEIVRNNQATPA
jgi:hypothetical protein